MLKRSVSLVVLSAVVALLVANLVLFTIVQNDLIGNDWGVINIFENSGRYEYRGFEYIYRYLSTYPGLNNSLEVVNTVAQTVSGEFDVTQWNALNAILGVLYVMTTPITLIITFVIDVINNVIWIFGFFLPNI